MNPPVLPLRTTWPFTAIAQLAVAVRAVRPTHAHERAADLVRADHEPVCRAGITRVAMCDHWFFPDRGDLNKSRYLGLPVEVDPAARTAQMTFR
jgi:hypothetical protein